MQTLHSPSVQATLAASAGTTLKGRILLLRQSCRHDNRRFISAPVDSLFTSDTSVANCTDPGLPHHQYQGNGQAYSRLHQHPTPSATNDLINTTGRGLLDLLLPDRATMNMTTDIMLTIDDVQKIRNAPYWTASSMFAADHSNTAKHHDDSSRTAFTLFSPKLFYPGGDLRHCANMPPA